MSFVVDLTGGPPLGFSMTGGSDFNQPLTVSKVNTITGLFGSNLTGTICQSNRPMVRGLATSLYDA